MNNAFNLDGLRVAGCLEKEIKTVSIVGGSGSSEFFTAMKASDILITGQVPHHLGIEALENDFAVIEVSHAIEFYGLEMLKKKLKSVILILFIVLLMLSLLRCQKVLI